MKTNNNTDTTTNLPQFILKMKKQDKLFENIFKVLKILYLILIAVGAILIFVKMFNNTPYIATLKEAGLLLSSIIFYFYLKKRHNEYKELDYSQPTYLVLKSIVKRYSSFEYFDLWALAAITIVGISLSLDSRFSFLVYQLGYWTMMLISILGGLTYRFIKIKPLKDRALQLLKELEE